MSKKVAKISPFHVIIYFIIFLKNHRQPLIKVKLIVREGRNVNAYKTSVDDLCALLQLYCTNNNEGQHPKMNMIL